MDVSVLSAVVSSTAAIISAGSAIYTSQKVKHSGNKSSSYVNASSSPEEISQRARSAAGFIMPDELEKLPKPFGESIVLFDSIVLTPLSYNRIRDHYKDRRWNSYSTGIHSLMSFNVQVDNLSDKSLIIDNTFRVQTSSGVENDVVPPMTTSPEKIKISPYSRGSFEVFFLNDDDDINTLIFIYKSKGKGKETAQWTIS